MNAKACAGRQAPLHVLVVDDNELTRMHVLHVLRRQGMTVVEARDGREALELAACEVLDCILLDVQLPDMDGLAVTRAIRTGSCAPANSAAIPILALTAFATPEDRRRCLDAGMTGYLTKPVRTEDLMAAMGTISRPAPAFAATEEAGVFDISECAKHGRPGFVGQILALFLDLAAPKGDALRAAITRRDLPAAAALAHDLAGMAGPIRAMGLHAAMKALQETCTVGDQQTCRLCHDRADRELAAVLAAVRVHPALGRPRG